MNEQEIEKYIRTRAHQMFGEEPGLYTHQGIIRQFLRLAFIDGSAQQERAADADYCVCEVPNFNPVSDRCEFCRKLARH